MYRLNMLIKKIVVASCLVLIPLTGMTEIVVIVHPSSSATISKTDVERLYLAKTKAFGDGTTAIPLNHAESSPTRIAFDSQVVGKSEPQMKSYWAKLLFTGKAVPIKQLSNDSEIISTVASTPGAIGYVDAVSINDSVKVVFSF